MNVTVKGTTRHYRTVTFNSQTNRVMLIEQRLLPHDFKIVGTKDYRETARAITEMVVRGAGAIGATAAYGVAQGALAFKGSDLKKFNKHVRNVYHTLTEARPTAVDPVNAMNQVLRHMAKAKNVDKNQALPWGAQKNSRKQDV